MARPDPYPCANTSRPPRGLQAAALALALVGCRSDEPLEFTTEIDPTTGEYLTMGIEFTTGPYVPEPTTGEEMPTETTCSAAITCIVQCALMHTNPGPEEDLSCFRECVSGMSTAEWLALIDFAECTYYKCRDDGICTDHGENDDEACRGCVIGNLGNKNTPGCEAEGAACY
jgi:hypothetical protein